MSLDRNVFRVILITETENDDMTNTDDEMTNKRMGRNHTEQLLKEPNRDRNIFHFLYRDNPSYSSQYSVNIQRETGSMIVFKSKNSSR